MVERILLVEDDPVLRETLVYNLGRQNYQIDLASDGQAAIEEARKHSPDLIVLDLMIPLIDGFEVCRILRNESNVPILILTARDDEIDRVLGLEMGADDYLTKPFSMREFLARVKAHLRRVKLDREENLKFKPDGDQDFIISDNLVIDTLRREVRLEGKALPLKPKEYELLLFLAKHRGQALSRDLILDRVWGWNFSGGTRTVDVHMLWLRRKIEPDPENPTRIVTVRGTGYRFEG